MVIKKHAHGRKKFQGPLLQVKHVCFQNYVLLFSCSHCKKMPPQRETFHVLTSFLIIFNIYLFFSLLIAFVLNWCFIWLAFLPVKVGIVPSGVIFRILVLNVASASEVVCFSPDHSCIDRTVYNNISLPPCPGVTDSVCLHVHFQYAFYTHS